MIVLGIDPGIATVGFGVVETSGVNDIAHVAHGIISTEAGLRLAVRLHRIYHDASELIETFRPGAIAIEELFFNTNQKTAVAVAHGRGCILLAGEEHTTPMFEYTPLQVKQAVAGYGRAEKRQVMDMVKRMLCLDRAPRPDDAADALAVAICHAKFSGSLMGALRGGDVCSTI
ncbi:MAG: crossover junction endodeoxyribonuclease RuvC [Oscillospiraceae bacterium]|nr:crossover junction endodeoxyribonuclease RuvC [Oscillospiraceae bacterium]